MINRILALEKRSAVMPPPEDPWKALAILLHDLLKRALGRSPNRREEKALVERFGMAVKKGDVAVENFVVRLHERGEKRYQARLAKMAQASDLLASVGKASVCKGSDGGDLLAVPLSVPLRSRKRAHER